MIDLLFLAHRIPWPPDKGDKIRSHHLLRHLCGRYRVHLGCFVDDPADLLHESALREICTGEILLHPLHPRWARVVSLAGVIRGEPLTLAHYRSRRFAAWVEGILARHPIQRLVVYSSGVAPYAMTPQARLVARRLLDFVDVDSRKWSQYALTQPWPQRWIYAREARLLAAAERVMAADFDASLVVSPAEAALLKEVAPESAPRIGYWENGVDGQFFDPSGMYANPYQPEDEPLVFTGAMDYPPNVDAVTWFAEEAFPSIRSQRPHARFVIVGSRPSTAVQQLAERPGVTVTGRVADVRPWLAHARLAVAPMRLGQGVQNKVLEALAMARPVVVTAKAVAGIRLCPGLHELVAGTAKEQAELALELLSNPERAANLGRLGRACVQEHHTWEATLRRVDACLENTPES